MTYSCNIVQRKWSKIQQGTELLEMDTIQIVLIVNEFLKMHNNLLLFKPTGHDM